MDNEFTNFYTIMGNEDFILENVNNKLSLKSLKHKEWLPFSIDFTSNDIIRRVGQIGLNEAIARAVGVKKDFKPKVLDTTAGLGRDSFLLASLGCNVVMLERNPTIFALLSDAIDRVMCLPIPPLDKDMENLNGAHNRDSMTLNELGLEAEVLRKIINKMTLLNKDSIEFLKESQEHFDTIYIDPMFPKSKKSRLVKKDMQVFREVVGDDLDSANLLALALKKDTKRVVVKRMSKSEYLSDIKPSFEISNGVVRFDIYM